MKHLLLFEKYKRYNRLALDYANKYYSDETGDAPYGDYSEILDRLNTFCTTKFPYGLKNMPKKVILYRLLNVESVEDINKEELGESYVGDKKMFEDEDFLESFLHRYGEETKKWFIVTIETGQGNIDISGTLGNRAEYPDEYEIKLINHKNLKILGIEEIEPNT